MGLYIIQGLRRDSTRELRAYWFSRIGCWEASAAPLGSMFTKSVISIQGSERESENNSGSFADVALLVTVHSGM